MSGKVIPFPAVGKAGRSAEPIIARHHIELQLGRNRYDVDVIGFIQPLPVLSAPPQGNVPVPFNHYLEMAMQPSVENVIAKAKEICYR